MNAIEILREMHVEAKSSFQKIEKAAAKERGSLWAKLQPELAQHEQLEEQFVYQPLAEEVGKSDPVLAEWWTRHPAEVQQAEALMGEIARLDPASDPWLEQVTKLRRSLDAHIQAEEGNIFPRITHKWGDAKLEAAGAQLQAARSSTKKKAQAA